MPKYTVQDSCFYDYDTKCFIEWLTIELAPTILGSKPATVLSFMNSSYQAALTIWQQQGCEMLKDSLVQFTRLRCKPNLQTVLFYRKDVLERCVDYHNCFLKELGYPVDESVDQCLALLHERFKESCPHEIGILLGIPLKDVLGFMELSGSQLTCRKEWCIYGNPAESFVAMERFAADKAFVSCLLSKGITPAEIILPRPHPLNKIA